MHRLNVCSNSAYELWALLLSCFLGASFAVAGLAFFEQFAVKVMAKHYSKCSSYSVQRAPEFSS